MNKFQKQINVDEYKILFSAKEFKKTRVEYFVENEFSLEEELIEKLKNVLSEKDIQRNLDTLIGT